jgi:hypothetical protein
LWKAPSALLRSQPWSCAFHFHSFLSQMVQARIFIWKKFPNVVSWVHTSNVCGVTRWVRFSLTLCVLKFKF